MSRLCSLNQSRSPQGPLLLHSGHTCEAAVSIDFHICDKILVINNFQGGKIDFGPRLQRFLSSVDLCQGQACGKMGCHGCGNMWWKKALTVDRKYREEGSEDQAEPSKSPLMA